MCSTARSALSSGKVVGMDLIASIGARNSVMKSSSEASWRSPAWSGRSDSAKEALERASQRRDTPCSSNAPARPGRMVERAN